MTSTKNSTEPKIYSTLPYFRFNLKQNWQQLALFLILTLFIMLLSSYIQIQETLKWIDRGGYSSWGITPEDIIEKTQNNMLMISMIGIFVSGGLAVISGMTAMSYVNSKKNVGCYHSFPIRRESMFLIEATTPVVYFLLSIIAGYALSYLMFLVTLNGTTQFAGNYFTVMLISIALYLFIYCTFLFAGGLTGTHVMKFIMVLIIYFLPIAVYIITIALLTNTSSIYESYYISIEAVGLISPIFHVICSIVLYFETGSMAWGFILISSLVMYLGALVLNKFRKSESSGTTVIWRPIFIFVKYAMIFGASLLGTWIFYYIGDENPISVFFGLVFGGVVALVLMNCIMYRSTKAMFKDFKKFLIFTACTLVFVIIVPFNITGLIGKPYTDSLTKSVTLITDRGTYVTYEDKDDIEMIMELFDDRDYERLRYVNFVYSEDTETMESIIEYFPDYVISGSYYTEEGYYNSNGEFFDNYGNRVPDKDIDPVSYSIQETQKYVTSNVGNYTTVNTTLTVIQKPYIGIPLAKTVSVDVNSKLWDKIINTEEYSKSTDLSEIYADATLIEVDYNILGYEGYYGIGGTADDNALANRILEACEFSTEKRDNSILLGHIYMYFILPESNFAGTTRTSIYYPVYAADIELINLIGELVVSSNDSLYELKYGEPQTHGTIFTKFKTEDDVIKHLVDSIACAALVNVDTLEAKLIDNVSIVSELVTDVSCISGQDWSIRQFMRSVDTDYILLISYGSTNRQVSTHFRPDTVTNEELKAIFNSLE